MLTLLHYLLQGVLDACYLFFQAAVINVTVLVEMGCCESRNLTEDNAPVIYDDSEQSTGTSTVSESSREIVSSDRTNKSESNHYRTVNVQPLRTLDSCTTADKNLFVAPDDCYDFVKEDKTAVLFQDASIPSSEASPRKKKEASKIYSNTKVQNVVGLAVNVHGVAKGSDLPKCFQNSSEKQGTSNIESLHSEEIPCTQELHGDTEHRPEIDLIVFPKENDHFISGDNNAKQVLLEPETDLIVFPKGNDHLISGDNNAKQVLLESSPNPKANNEELFKNSLADNINVSYPDIITHCRTSGVKSKTPGRRTRTYSEVLKKDSKETLKINNNLSSKTIAVHTQIPMNPGKAATGSSALRQTNKDLLNPENHMFNQQECLQYEHKTPVVLASEFSVDITQNEQILDPTVRQKKRTVVQNLILSSSMARSSVIPVDHDLDSALSLDDQYLSLAPTCETTQKEVVSMSSEASELTKKIRQAEKLIYLMIAYVFYEKLTTPKDLASIDNYVLFCTEEMKSALYRIKGKTLLSKVEVFLTQFSTVFCKTGDTISRQSNGEEWLYKSVMTTLIDVVEDCAHQGQNTLSEICRTLKLILGSIDIPWVGKLLPENISVFIKNNLKTVNVINDSVLLVTKSNTSLGVSANQQCMKDVAKYFKELLKTKAVPHNELSLLLSNDKPELLAALVHRKPQDILDLVLKDKSFKFENGLLMLKGYTPVQLEVHKSSAPSDVSSKSETLDICVCSSGIVMSVGKSRATFWCSYSQICKNIFVIARRSRTRVDDVLGENFTNILNEGDKVVFTCESDYEDGWVIDFAMKVKVVGESVWQTTCLCTKSKEIDVFLQPIVISNGIPLSNSLNFFWNCKGIVLCIQGTKGIVKCPINETSDRYFLVFFTNCVWLSECNLSKNLTDFAEYLTVGEEVECDVSLINHHNSGFLTWFGVCIRKVSYNLNAKCKWNCSGTVVGVDSHHFVISMQTSAQEKNNKFLLAPFQNIFLREDGSVLTSLPEDILKISDTVVFDLEMDSPCIAKFLRKHYRPVSKTTVTKTESPIAATALKIEMDSNVPLFKNVNIGRDILFFNECNELKEQQTIFVDYLSHSTDTYHLTFPDSIKSVKDTDCQTISTGPIFSTLIPI